MEAPDVEGLGPISGCRAVDEEDEAIMDCVLLTATIDELSYSTNSYLWENKILYNNFDINI